MNKITADSPKRLIVVDAVDEVAQNLFGDKYDYDIKTTFYDPIEDYVNSLQKPKWTTVLGDESTELINHGRTLANDVLINVLITAKVPSNNIAHAMPYLEDIETIKRELVGVDIEHKDHVINGGVQNEDRPAWSATHDIDHSAGGSVLRIEFAIVMRIHDEQ
jgi:hypothetical protein